MSPTLALTEDLLRRPSVSPEDHGCIDVICARLEPLGFSNERLRFGPVENLWSRRGDGSPVLECPRGLLRRVAAQFGMTATGSEAACVG